MLHLPSLSQSVQPALLPLLPQQLKPLQTLEEHWDEEEQLPPSDRGRKHSELIKV